MHKGTESKEIATSPHTKTRVTPGLSVSVVRLEEFGLSCVLCVFRGVSYYTRRQWHGSMILPLSEDVKSRPAICLFSVKRIRDEFNSSKRIHKIIHMKINTIIS